MERNIEVELRGPISLEKIQEIEEIFQKGGKFKKNKNRVLIDYSSSISAEDISGRTKDIRLRVTNGIPEIIIKTGRWGGTDSRKEISVFTNKGEFDNLVHIFGSIGLKKGVLCVRNSKVYDYKGIEFALVEVPGHSYYFEAEKMVGSESEKLAAVKTIGSVCKELGLKVFSSEEFYKYIEDLNKSVNEIFDFDKYEDNYFKNRFGL